MTRRCVKAGCRRRRQRPSNGWVFAACPGHTVAALNAFGGSATRHQDIPESTRLGPTPRFSSRALRGALLAPPPA